MTASASWVAFGFSDYGNLIGSDLCIFTPFNQIEDGRMKINNQIYRTTEDQKGFIAIDSHVDSNGYLKEDFHQNYILERVLSQGNDRYFIVSRKFNTCDKNYDYTLDRGTTHVLYISESIHPILFDASIHSNNLFPMAKESKSGFQWGFNRAQLLKSQIVTGKVTSETNDTHIFHITFDKAPVPANSTTYWKKLIKLPEYFSKKHHIIKYQSKISKETENVVHHLMLFHCQIPKFIIPDFYEGPSDTPNEPKLYKKCKKVIVAWAMGAQPFIFPQEAGLTLGGSDQSLYVVLEAHFNNPNNYDGILDSSGFSIYLTSKLRKYDTGFLEIGYEYSPKLMIPPGQEKFLVHGYCVPECTNGGIPTSGITVFANQFHTHLLGKKIIARIIRNGVEIGELNRDNHYSPHAQEIRLLPKIVTLYPGDQLIVTCFYDSSMKKIITNGGLATTDEMCITYLFYYPRVNLERCRSSISIETLNKFFAYK
ncbi:dopamine beta-hydroxylase-like [Gordionus sp. m RMFG-2023]|uniref:dopamine beta-hydroxylase-like n=1 Tax=Gordionus sp. m RMFG-2023 TaxID=3053472 RepID=UPI0031FCCD50